MRKFKDIYPAALDRSNKIVAASKWHQVETMTPELAGLFVRQLSIWSRSLFKMRGNAYAICPHPVLRGLLMEIAGEEDVVDPRIGMNHRQLVATSLGKALGLSLADLEKAQPLATTLVTFDIFFGIAARSWEEGIAISSGHERLIRDSGFFGFEVNRLKRDLGWSDKDVEWFTAHDVADEEHGKLVEMLDDFITDDSAWDRVEEALVQSQIAYFLMLDGIVDAWKYDIKPVKGASCKGLSLIF